MSVEIFAQTRKRIQSIYSLTMMMGLNYDQSAPRAILCFM